MLSSGCYFRGGEGPCGEVEEHVSEGLEVITLPLLEVVMRSQAGAGGAELAEFAGGKEGGLM